MLATLSPNLQAPAPVAAPSTHAGSAGNPGFARLLDGATQARAEAQSQQQQHQEAGLQDTRQAQQQASQRKTASAVHAPGSANTERTAPRPHPSAAAAAASWVAPRSDTAELGDDLESPQTTPDGVSTLLTQMRSKELPSPTTQVPNAAAESSAAVQAVAAVADGSWSANKVALVGCNQAGATACQAGILNCDPSPEMELPSPTMHVSKAAPECPAALQAVSAVSNGSLSVNQVALATGNQAGATAGQAGIRNRSPSAESGAPRTHPAAADTVAEERVPSSEAAGSQEALEIPQTPTDGLSELLAQLRGAAAPGVASHAALATPASAESAAAARAAAEAGDGGKPARAAAPDLGDAATGQAAQVVARTAGKHAGPGSTAGSTAGSPAAIALRARHGGNGHGPAATDTAINAAAGQSMAATSAPASDAAQAAHAASTTAARTTLPATAAGASESAPTLPLAGLATAGSAAGTSTGPLPQTLPGEARLSAAPGSADFAPQLGAQITTFARHGVEHARLHLNPADMGPVMVQIQLDGAAAQIHMSAEHPATRQALEQAMPALASGLREAGLTLAGGGVFEQPQQAQDQAQARSDAQQRQAAAPAALAGADPRDASGGGSRPALQRRGLVDLVA